MSEPASRNSLSRPPAVSLENVTRSYPDGPQAVIALDAVTLQIEAGSFTAVMGPSGSGKSTFLNCASGLDTPSSGRVVVGGKVITGLNADTLTRFRREHVGFVFQGYNLVRHLTVAENIRLPLTLASSPIDDRKLTMLLEAVGLTGMDTRLPGELSGGQAQRVAIARALITSPDVVFADEPTGALDAATAENILELFRSTVRNTGQTLVLVTHDARAAAYADRVLFLADGRLCGELRGGTVEEIAARVLQLGR